MDVGVACACRAVDADVDVDVDVDADSDADADTPAYAYARECAVMAEWAEEGLCAVPPMLVRPRALAVDLGLLAPAMPPWPPPTELDRRIVP